MLNKKSTCLSSNGKENFTFCVVKTPISVDQYHSLLRLFIEEMYPLRTTYVLHVYISA